MEALWLLWVTQKESWGERKREEGKLDGKAEEEWARALGGEAPPQRLRSTIRQGEKMSGAVSLWVRILKYVHGYNST